MVKLQVLSQLEFFPAAVADNSNGKFVFQGNIKGCFQVLSIQAKFFRICSAGYNEFKDRFPDGFPLFGQVPEHVLEQKCHCSVNSRTPAAAGCNLQDLYDSFPASVRNLDLLKLEIPPEFRDYYFNIRVNRQEVCAFAEFLYF